MEYMNSIDNRQHVHSLIDQLLPSQLAAIDGLLAVMLDPVGAALRDAPREDEEETEEEHEAVEHARRSLSGHGGRGTPHVDAMRRLGLD